MMALITSAYRRINKLRRRHDVELRDLLKHEKESPYPFRLLTISLFGLGLMESVLRLFIILTHDPKKSFELFYHAKNEDLREHAYEKFKRVHARVRLFTATGGIVIVLSSALVGYALNIVTGIYQNALAATYSWTQTQWSTLSTNTTGHPAPSNWLEYSATTTSLTVGATLSLGTVTASTSQTTDTDFSAGTQSSTAVSGSGINGDVGLSQNYASPAWTQMQSAPGTFASGNGFVHTGGDYIYALQGNNATARGFYRYSISGNSWTTLALTPATINYGGALAYPGTGDYIYASRGNNNNSFYRYSISGDSWTSMTNSPVNIYGGGSIVSTGGDYIYVFPGNGTRDLWRYSISGNSWAAMASTTPAINDGASLTYPGSGDYIYASTGLNSVNWVRYSISGNSWSAMTNIPIASDITTKPSSNGGDYIYIVPSSASTVFLRYSISGNSWTYVANTLAGTQSGTATIYPSGGNYLFASVGNSASFYRYTPANETGWSSLTNSIANGIALAYPGSGDYIYNTYSGAPINRYSISGNSWAARASDGSAHYGYGLANPSGSDYLYVLSSNGSTGFSRYSMSGNTWSAMAVTPIANNIGALVSTNDDYLYAFFNSFSFYRYSISGNSWSAMTSIPVTEGAGASLAYPGSGDYIYAFPGGNSQTFYRYSISGNSWSAMTAPPLKIYGSGTLYSPGSGDYLYAFAGNYTYAFMRYSISGNLWESMAATPAAISGASQYGSMTSAGNSIYAIGGTPFLFWKFNFRSYSSSGTFTSSVVDTGVKQAFTTITYTKSTPANTTLTIDVRAGDTASPDGSWTAWQTDVASGGSISGLGANRYVQYRANLASSDTTVTPSLSDVTINYSVYPSGQTLTSSKFDSTVVENLMGGISWTEDATLPTGAYTAVSIRASSTAGLLGTTNWVTLSSTSTNCSKTSAVVTCTSGALPAAMRSGTGAEWFQYMVTLSSRGDVSPTLSDITVSYVVNAQPELQNVTASEQSDGTVNISYETRDPDATAGTFTPGYIAPSFEYSTNGGSSWTPILSGLSTNATSTKAVSESTWNTYTATWDAKSALNGLYATTAQIRVTVNDGETAMNTRQLATLDFTLDEKSPTLGSPVAILRATYSPALLTLDVTDDSALQMKVGRLPDLSDAAWVTFATSSTITLVTEPDTVYAQFKDAYANTTSIQAVTTPTTPTSVITRDLSNTGASPTYRLFVSWGVVPVPGPGFGAYRLYRSTDGSSYSLYSTVTSRTTNYIMDDNGGGTLDGNTTYYYKVYVDDVNGNTSYYSGVVSDRPNGQGGTDATPPTITGVSATTTTQTATINWTTDELSDSTVGYCVSPCSDYSTTQGVNSFTLNHEVVLSGLMPGQTYSYVVSSRDPSSNLSTSDPLTFTTLPGPSISNVAVIRASNTSADITWDTDIPASSYVAYATNTPPTGGVESIAGLAALVTTRIVGVSGLTPGRTYYFYVRSVDGSGNTAEDKNVVSGVSTYYKFNTSDDATPPTLSSVDASTVTDVAAIVSWLSDEIANSVVEWGTSSGVYASSTTRLTYDITHYIALEGLTANTAYYYRVSSSDQNGNTATSTEYTFTTRERLYGESERIVEQIVYASHRDPEGVSQVLYDTLQKQLTETKDALATALKQLDEIRFEVLGLKADDTTDPKALLKIVSEKFSALTKIFEKNTALDLTESDITPVAQTLRDLAEAVPPPIIKGAPQIDIVADRVTVSWTSDKETNSILALAKKGDYDPSKGDPYTQEYGLSDRYEVEHKVTLDNLLPSTEYHFQIRSATQLGSKVKTRDFTFTTPVQLPEITDAHLTQLENGKLRISWHTNVLTNAAVRYTPFEKGKPVASKSATFGKPDYLNEHEITLEQLKSGTTYDLELLSTDPYGNTAKRPMPNYATGKDLVPPAISHVRTDITVFPGAGNKIQAIVFWDTDELATSQVLYEEGSATDTAMLPKEATLETSDMDTSHTVIVANWKPDTVYRFRVLSVDAAGNKGESKDYTVKTPQKKASIIDIIVNNFSTTFSWTKNIGL